MRNDKNMPSQYEIMDYWRRKSVTENFTIKDVPEFCSNIVPDPDVPVCFACGQIMCPPQYINKIIDTVWDNADRNKKSDDEIAELVLKRLWNDRHIHLQRCHIIPDSLGGSSSVNNLFLMCNTCHADSPDTVYSEQFFRFIVKRKGEGPLFVRALNEAYAVVGNKLNTFYHTFEDIEDMWDLMFTEISTHGFKLSQSSITAWLIHKSEEVANE